MRAAQRALQLGDRVVLGGIDDHVGAELLRQLELGVVDVDRGDVEAHRLGVLHRHVAEPADAGDRHPVAGLAVEHLEALVDGHAGAQHRRDLGEADARRQVADVAGIGAARTPHSRR